MNRNKFLQIQKSFIAKGEDIDVLNHIVDEIIYKDMYSQMFNSPYITNDQTEKFKIIGSVVVARGLTIPKNISELRSNKFNMAKRIVSKLAADGWKIPSKSLLGDNNIRFEYHEENGKISNVHYDFTFKPMNWFDKLMYKIFKSF